MKTQINLAIVFTVALILSNCSKDDNTENTISCSESEVLLYEETNGLIVVEFESTKDTNGWSKESNINGFSGSHYLIWKGDSYMNNPGNGLLTYKLKISNPGTYRFLWRSRIAKGDLASEHNDSWLRFEDADAFYGKKGESIVYPGGTGQTPTPNGSSKEGWFKIYMNGLDQWKYQSSTSDNDAHQIFVEFNSPGTYTMEVSARSDYHALDRFVLFSSDISQNIATDNATELSFFDCSEI